MATQHFSVHIKRRPEEVFAYLVDSDNLPQWQEGVIETHRSPAGPLTTGTRITKTRKTPTGLVTFTDLVTEFEPDKRIFSQLTVDSMVKGTVGKYRVVPSGDGADLLQEVQVKASGFWKVLQPYIARSVKQTILREQEKLRELLER